MIKVGQYVRAVLAEGIAAALPETEGFEAQLDREGVVAEMRPALGTFVLVDVFENEHVCHINGATVVDTTTLDEFIRVWALSRAQRLGVQPTVSP